MPGDSPQDLFATVAGWNHSSRRGWTTLASFSMQALAVSLLLAMPLIWVQRPPLLWVKPLTSPAAFAPPGDPVGNPGHRRNSPVPSPSPHPLIAPSTIPPSIQIGNDPGPAAPELPDLCCGPSRGPGGILGPAIGIGTPVVIPPRPAAAKPVLISHLSEADLLHRVQPIYPTLARQAHVQGAVELRAIISKTGTIENLVVVRGHPMLAAAAIEAVRQWRYRPYLLNNEPVEVETQITVNFLLAGN